VHTYVSYGRALVLFLVSLVELFIDVLHFKKLIFKLLIFCW